VNCDRIGRPSEPEEWGSMTVANPGAYWHLLECVGKTHKFRGDASD